RFSRDWSSDVCSSDLNWIATLPPSLLGALPDGTVSLAVSVTDKFGNVVNDTANITVAVKTQPAIVLDPLFGDGVLSIPELLNGEIGRASGRGRARREG